MVVGEDTNNGRHMPLAWCHHHQRELVLVVGEDTNNGRTPTTAAGRI